MRTYSLTTTLLLLVCSLPATIAWGSLGHRTVAYLASLYFTPQATKFTNQLLNAQDISEAALFPDKVAHLPQFAFSRAWHYIDARDDPPRQCGINYTRDCPSTHNEGCVVSAIANHTARVVDPRLPNYLRGQSLRFVLHFIGDIHQPLHTEAEDRGGNEIHVLFDGTHTNLHSVWDSGVVNKYMRRIAEDESEAAWIWANKLFNQDQDSGGIKMEQECTRDAKTCALEWAGEANKYVCSYVLKDDVEGVEGRDLGGEYYEGAVPIVEEMIAKAGKRLGAWVNVMTEMVGRREDLDGLDTQELR